MAEAHTPSDNAAITAAQDSLTAIASRVLLQRVDEHLRRPTRWSHEALVAASAAVWDRHVADLEERAGRAEGSFGGVVRHHPKALDRRDNSPKDWPLGTGTSMRASVPVEASPVVIGRLLDGSGYATPINPNLIAAAPHGERTPLPRVCAETDGDCA